MKIKEVFKRKWAPKSNVKSTKTNGTLIKPFRWLSFAVLKTFNFYKLLYHLNVFVSIKFKWKTASEHFSDLLGESVHYSG